MKTIKTLLLSLFVSSSMLSYAQTVTIPDAGFVDFLEYTFPTCMSGNLMDTTCADIVNATNLDIPHSYGVADLDGIQYFDNLEVLIADFNPISSVPYLPMDLIELDLRYINTLTNITNFPTTLEVLLLASSPLTSIPPLPPNLIEYQRDGLPNVPIETSLPSTLEQYSLRDCDAINLPPLPAGLEHLTIDDNVGINIPSPLPSGLIVLRINGLNLSALPPLPNSLYYLHAGENNFSTVTSLPPNLVQLYLHSNPNLTTIQNLPNNLQQLWAFDCSLNSIDFLPNSMMLILLQNNNLTSIPNFPTLSDNVNLENNNLTSLPPVPANIENLYLSNNSISCMPVLPNSISQISLENNIFSCLPNIIPAMSATFQGYPLCEDNDPVNNPFGCMGAEGIEGYTYVDQNTNCTYEATDSTLINIPITVSNQGNVVAQVSSFNTGRYYFPLTSAGQYEVAVDTLNKPYTYECMYPGVDSTVTLSSGTPLASNVDFGLRCKTGFDVGTRSTATSGWVFPGQPHTLSVKSGDMSNYYNMNCSDGVSGSVTVTVTGPVTFLNPSAGSLIPVVSGNTYTYTVNDFGTVNPDTDFRLDFSTDTTAQSGDLICVTVDVTPNSGDNNLANNTYTNCYSVVNSYDPNNKLVYPSSVEPGFDDYLTYTINFQNTGTAPAFNIRLEDTLSSYLDLSTFEVLDYSHPMHYNLSNNILNVYYNNIMLVDSTTSEPDSKGHITFRVKANGNLIEGDEIENTAHIFFDFNPAIITNTIVTAVEVDDAGLGYQNKADVGIYPNPSSKEYYIVSDQKINEVQVFDHQGKQIRYSFDATQRLLDLKDNTPGIYFMQIVLDNQIITKKLIKK